MTLSEFNKIVLRRASFRKKGLLHVLVAFFPLDSISHNEVDKVYIIPTVEVSRLNLDELNILEKLLRPFSIYDSINDGKIYIKYSWL